MCDAQALAMNDAFMREDDLAGVQPAEEIRSLLAQAQAPGPSLYNFSSAEASFDVLEGPLLDELLDGCDLAA